jgi:ABC-type phosphate transport system substrate-binding protein
MRPFTIIVPLTIGLVLALLAGLPVVARAQEGFVLIANLANPVSTLPRDEASKLFLLKRSRWASGEHARPVDQVESSSVRRRFSNAIHGMDVPSVKSFWQEIVFSGKGDPPPERASDAEVIAFVKGNPNGLGYVGSATPADGVKIIIVAP